MIILGYPGEVTAEIGPKLVWGALSTIPFLYILWILFVELGKSMGRQPAGVAKEVRGLRLTLIGTWGVYPISYLFPAWLTVLNDVRLALGTRVGISADDQEESITGEEEIDHAKDIYSWLTWLQSNLLEEMNS